MARHTASLALVLSLALPSLLALAGCGGGAAPGIGVDAGPDQSLPDIPPYPVPDAPPSSDANLGTNGQLGPPYPIVLAHGFFGFQDFAGIDFVTYFYQVKDHLASAGEELVFTPAVDPFNSSDVRGDQLRAAVDMILAQTGKAKVVIIGHSQGGLDARKVAHDAPDKVAAVVTIAAPHQGTPVSDVVLGLVPFDGAQQVIDAIVRLLGGPLYDTVGNDTSLTTALRQFSTPGITDFNNRYPDVPGIPYYSITGRSLLASATEECATETEASFITPWNDTLDTLEPLLSPLALVMGSDPHDGLVPVKSGRWGEFWGCVPADHFDEIGQLFGDTPGIDNGWKYLGFYLDLVKRVRELGY
jgi:triacylglycerol lipase